MLFKLSNIRLKTDRLFKEVFLKGQALRSELFDIYVLRFSENINEKKIFKFAVIVPKECGKAVERNRVKRLVREFFRLNNHILADSYMIVRFKKKPHFRKYGDAEKIFKEFFAKHNLLKIY